jgi:hypothetical protein
MAGEQEPRPGQVGLYQREPSQALTGIEVAGLGLAALWMLLSGGFFLFGGADLPDGGLGFVIVLMVIVLPVALIWVAVMAARSARVMREEGTRLRAAIDAIRQAYVAQAQQGRSEQPHPAILKRLDEMSATQKGLETTLAMLVSVRAAEAALPAMAPPATVPEAGDQPALMLGTPSDAMKPPLSSADFIRAVNFPETAEDKDGFAALRRALKDRQAAQLIQAAQDVLTLLSQDGIYMDDLRPDLARPEIWRAFARGTRGREIAVLGGVRDRSSLTLAAGRMRADTVHHFLRRFDQTLAGFEPNASDAELAEFGNTRTARAFMLLGRVAGTFD